MSLTLSGSLGGPLLLAALSLNGFELGLVLSRGLGCPLLLKTLGLRGFELGLVLSRNLCRPLLLKALGLGGFELGLVLSRLVRRAVGPCAVQQPSPAPAARSSAPPAAPALVVAPGVARF